MKSISIPVFLKKEIDAHAILKQIEFIEQFNIDSSAQLIQITYDSSKIKLSEIIQLFTKNGIEVPIQSKKYHVVGMTCAACALKIEKTNNKQNGIIHAQVNYANHTAAIQYIEGITNLYDIQQKIHQLGYELLEEAQNKKSQINEQQLLKKELIYIGILTLPIFVFGMFMHHSEWGRWISFFFTIPILFKYGKNFHINAIKQAKMFYSNMDTLVSLSTITAFIYSTYNLFSTYFSILTHIAHDVYFESVAVIILFIKLGKYIEEKAKKKTSSAIEQLIQLQPKEVTILQNGEEKIIPLTSVMIHDKILVKPGEKLAVDGTVIQGISYVNESMLSGESIPVLKTVNKQVFAGTLNQDGVLTVEVKKTGNSTLLSKIIQSVEQAQGSKPKIQLLADKIAAIFVPIIIIIAIATFVSWNLFSLEDSLQKSIIYAVTVLIIACPCALGLATPTALMVGIGMAAKKGILIKNADSLHHTTKVNTIVFDKTGTLTIGKPLVEKITWLKASFDKVYLANLLYSIESKSNHPLSKAITQHFNDATLIEIDAFENIRGMGIKAQHQSDDIFIGNAKFMQMHNISLNESYSNEISTKVFVAINHQLICLIHINDQISEQALEMVSSIKKSGIQPIILSGDNQESVKKVANELEIDIFEGELLPFDKENYIKNLQQKGKIVAMVGDGINDAQALAIADVGIAMGKGSAIAIDVADITIVNNNLSNITKSIHISKVTYKRIKQNLFWAFIYNIIGVPIATGIFYPWITINPMMAGLAMAFSSVSVVLNSLRMQEN
jgi:P-type Cu2+ transporter